jgi:hypothetical protein
MDAQDSNTFLEEFVSSSELLPTEVRRNFELMRELDRDVMEANRQCEEGEVCHPLLHEESFPHLN